MVITRNTGFKKGNVRMYYVTLRRARAGTAEVEEQLSLTNNLSVCLYLRHAAYNEHAPYYHLLPARF